MSFYEKVLCALNILIVAVFVCVVLALFYSTFK